MYRQFLFELRLILREIAMPATAPSIKIGTRGSQLALWQANWVKQQLTDHCPENTIEIVVIKTRGDMVLDTPLAKIGGKGLFVKEIEEALQKGSIDLAVHSLKDMPGRLPPGLTLGAVPVRETPWDALVAEKYDCLAALPAGARIGTSSLRRASQLQHRRPDLRIVPLRGNVDTRLGKLARGEMEAIILAAAGLLRLGMGDRITESLDKSVVLPAVAQGALGLEIRQDDHTTAEILRALDHRESRLAVTAERAFLQRLEGGCQVPIAAYAGVAGDHLTIEGLVADLSGKTVVTDSLSGTVDRAAELGVALAEKLLAAGAGEILQTLLDSGE